LKTRVWLHPCTIKLASGKSTIKECRCKITPRSNHPRFTYPPHKDPYCNLTNCSSFQSKFSFNPQVLRSISWATVKSHPSLTLVLRYFQRPRLLEAITSKMSYPALPHYEPFKASSSTESKNPTSSSSPSSKTRNKTITLIIAIILLCIWGAWASGFVNYIQFTCFREPWQQYSWQQHPWQQHPWQKHPWQQCRGQKRPQDSC